MTLSGDHAHLRPTPLNQGIGADGGAVGEHRDLLAEITEFETQVFTGELQSRDHTVGKMWWGRGGFRGNHGALLGNDHAICKRASNINANVQSRHVFSLKSFEIVCTDGQGP